ncbi:MAG: sugar transferase [Candidatus Hodarchaeota archaeon]
MDPKGFITNQLKYIEISSSSINNTTTMLFKSRIRNLVISHFILVRYIIFSDFVLIKYLKKINSTSPLKNLDVHTRRFLDIVGAIIGLLLSTILFFILPILIKLDSKGSVFYTQLRVGQNRRIKDRRRITAQISTERRHVDRRKTPSYGKPFLIYKFRTMKEGAEKKCGPVWASNNDPRITSVGRILRYAHIDKLPQLINILKGDMSFIGPKPERPYFVNQLAIQIPKYVERFKVRPGLTGLAQINIDYDYSLESIKKRLDYDLYYCHYGNFKSYFRIMFLSILKSIFGRTVHNY